MHTRTLHSRLLGRRAFTFVPLVVGVALVFIALSIALSLKAKAPVGAPGAYSTGYKLGPAVGSVLVSAFFVWVASAVDERRGRGWANIIGCGILGLAAFATSVNVARAYGWIKPAANGTAAQVPTVARATPQLPAPMQPVPTPTNVPSAPRATPAPVVTQDSPAATASTLSAPAPLAPPAAVPAREPSTKTVHEETWKPVLAALEAELGEQCVQAGDSALAALGACKALPTHSKKVLADRLTLVRAAQESLRDIATNLKGAEETLSQRLREKGINFDGPARVALATGFDPTSRQWAADKVVATLDRVAEECDLLDTHFSAWKLEKGDVSCKDAMLEHKLKSPRFFFQGDITQRDTLVHGLTQGIQRKEPASPAGSSPGTPPK